MIKIQCGERDLFVETEEEAEWVRVNSEVFSPHEVYTAVVKAQGVLDEARGASTRCSVGAASSGLLLNIDPDVNCINTLCYLFARDYLSRHCVFVEGPYKDRFYILVE